MLSTIHQRYHHPNHSIVPHSKCSNACTKITSGTLSPDTTATTSSGYSTGDSSISTTTNPSSNKTSSSIADTQDKTKPKGKLCTKNFKKTWNKDINYL